MEEDAMVDTAELQRDLSTSALALGLRDELADDVLPRLGGIKLGDLNAEICRGRDSLWVVVRRKGKGGVALRAAYVPTGQFECRAIAATAGEPLRFEIDSALGRHDICIEASGADLHRLCVRTTLRPAMDLRLSFLPRDLYPLGTGDDPLAAQGNVEAAQRGVNSGLVYFRLDEPAFGSVLYVQDLTVLNSYFRATGTVPSGVVGGTWPELGYLPPVRKADSAEADPLPAGEEITLSNAILVFRDWAGDNEREMARQFLQMLGTAYKALKLPEPTYRDWLWRADRSLADLESAPEATVRHYGHRYVMPYVKGEVPDIMVQMSVISSLYDYGKWTGELLPLEAELKKGLGKFYDPKVKTLRRFLPNVGEEKDPDAVDSWYLYHPMINLGRLAIDGDSQARDLLLKSVDYGIRAARHFKYKWPIMYRIQDFKVITKARQDGRFGQTDVNGIYAYLMMQLYQLTSDELYLDEAKAAIDAAKALRFDLVYQTNLTVWGAVACLRLWRITGESAYLAQSYVYLAGFFSQLRDLGIGDRSRGALPQLPGRDLPARCALYGDVRMLRVLRRIRGISGEQRCRSGAGGAVADQRILPLRARSRLVLLPRHAACGDPPQGQASERHHRPQSLLPARGSLRRWSVARADWTGNIRLRRSFCLRHACLPPHRGRPVSALLQPVHTGDGTNGKPRAFHSARWRRDLRNDAQRRAPEATQAGQSSDHDCRWRCYPPARDLKWPNRFPRAGQWPCHPNLGVARCEKMRPR